MNERTETHPRNKNALALQCMKEHGYPMPNIRRAMLKLADLKNSDLSKELQTSEANITLHLDAKRTTSHIQARIADLLHVPLADLFPMECK